MRHNSSAISFQTSLIAILFLKLRLPENNYLYKMSRRDLRLERGGDTSTFTPSKKTQITAHYFSEKRTKRERQNSIMIENFCKDPYQENPPHQYVEQLANHAHACIKTYYKLWRNRDKKNTILIQQSNLISSLNIQPQKFIRDIIDICEEGLCSWSKVKKKDKIYIQIELTGWGNVRDDQD